jgi:hypothetical protein
MLQLPLDHLKDRTLRKEDCMAKQPRPDGTVRTNAVSITSKDKASGSDEAGIAASDAEEAAGSSRRKN